MGFGSSAFRLFGFSAFRSAVFHENRSRPDLPGFFAALALWRNIARRDFGKPAPDSGRAAATQPQIGIVAIGLREPDARRQMAQRRRQP